MGTRKPLVQLIPEIVSHIERHRDTLQFNLRLYEVDEGQLGKEIEASLRKEMVSAPALHRALQRIPAINILKKAVDKLSKVYAQTPIRSTKDQGDQVLVDALVKVADVDNTLSCANRLYNLQRMCAVEFFVQDGKQSARVLAGHQFLPFSDDPTNPLNATVLIKYMGSEIKETMQVNSDDGTRQTQEKNIRNVSIFHLYSDDEFLVIDSEGTIRVDKMREMGLADGRNPYGTIPFVYINASKFELVPYPNKTGLDIAILVPKLLTDLNYAAQFLSHSIIWTKNADLAGAEIHPDSIVNLGDSHEGGDPEIGTIDPKTDIQAVLQLIEFQMSGYLSSIGIKAATVGSMMPGREASGFAKAMDEGDATQERNNQAEEFKRFERCFWEKLAKLQTYWSAQGKVTEKRLFTPDFVTNFSIRFGEMKHLTSMQEKVERVKTMRDLGLMSRTQAIKELNPDFTPEQVDKWIEELDADSTTQQKANTAQGGANYTYQGLKENGVQEDTVGPNKAAANV